MIKKLATKAFNKGSDNFGEKPTGNVIEFSYSKTLKQYFMVLEIMDGENAVTTDIGIIKNGDKYDFISGHKVFSVDNTDKFKSELKKAKKMNF